MEHPILLQIASYRDPDLPRTIRSALRNATVPDRLRFAICWQYDEATVSDLDAWLDDPRFRVDDVYYRRSEGLGWARYRCNLLYDGEPWMLQVDAHTRFAPDWDVRLLGMQAALPRSRTLLTTYPPGFRVEDGSEVFDDPGAPRELTLVEQRPDGAVMLIGRPVAPRRVPGRGRYLGGCFVFGPGAFVAEVPHDPWMYFHGEELALAVRAYTHGYDLAYPNDNVCWHRYFHPAPLHWQDRPDHGARHERAVTRLHALLIGDPTILGPFGLGTERTREEYFALAGLRYPVPNGGADQAADATARP